MRADVYAVEDAIERDHWWFTGRRRLFSRILERLGIDRGAECLDIGTSTGGNLRMLKDLGFRRVTGLDASDAAIAFCEAKGLGPVKKGDVCNLPFEDGRFRFVLATDVIEHVDDDRRALREIDRVLAPGGFVLITVPAFPSLWGLQDDVGQHRRRYLRGRLVPAIREAGLRPTECFYFNYLLFGPIWLARQVIRFLKRPLKSENQVNTPLLNFLLGHIFAVDVLTAPLLKPPFGVSLLVLCEKPAS